MIGMAAGLAQRGLAAVRLHDRDIHALSSVRNGARRPLLSKSAGDASSASAAASPTRRSAPPITRRRMSRSPRRSRTCRSSRPAIRPRPRRRRAGARPRSAARSICGSAKPANPTLPASCKEPWEFGKPRQLRPGSDVCILTYGPIVKRAMAVADRLEASGKRTAVYSVHTLKPLDREALAGILRDHPPRGRDRGMCAERQPGDAGARSGVDHRGAGPARYVHPAGCFYSLLRLARRYP